MLGIERTDSLTATRDANELAALAFPYALPSQASATSASMPPALAMIAAISGATAAMGEAFAAARVANA